MFDNNTTFFCFLFFNAFLLIFWSKIFLYAYKWVTLKKEFQVKIGLIVNFDNATKQKHINLSSLQRYLYEFIFILPKWVRIRVYFNKMNTTPCLFLWNEYDSVYFFYEICVYWVKIIDMYHCSSKRLDLLNIPFNFIEMENVQCFFFWEHNKKKPESVFFFWLCCQL